MNDSNYSPSLVSALKIARGMALQDKHNTFGVSHLVMAMFAENTGLKEILSSMQKDVGYIMEWFDTHREMYRSSGTSTEEVEPDEELSKVLDESERSKIKLGADSIDSICVFTAILREGVVYSHQQIEMLDVSEDDILSHYNALTPLHSYQGEEMQITASVPYADNELPESPESDYNPEDELISEELFARYVKALDRLPERCREVFIRIREEKQSYAQVAEELGISTKTVDAQLQKATGRLKEMIMSVEID